MNKKVFIKQDGTIPGHRIIEELERRGGSNRYSSYGGDRTDGCYYIENDQIKMSFPSPLKDYTELLYDKDTDSFYEKNECSDCLNVKGCINCHNGDMKETHWGEEAPSAQEAAKNMRMVSAEAKESLLPDKLIGVDVAKEGEDMTVITIPDGYEATIEGRKIIVKKKKWEPKVGDECYSVELYADALIFHVDTFTFFEKDDLDYWKRGTMFLEEAEAQVLCDKLNAAIAPIHDEIEKELEG